MDLLERLRTALASRYAVEREIGRGGMAIVFLARDLAHNRDVAIKVLKPEFAMAVSADRFLREIQLEARLNHPHILPLFDSGEANGTLYYVMPHVRGESLRSRLQRETQLPLDDTLRIAKDTAEALSYAHELGIVHRDVKPANILLGESNAFLADFGIARAVSELAGDRLSESGIVVGTPEYMSPEQCTEHGNVDPRSDVYALGCVVYEMLAGEPPFTGPTPQAVIARHLQEQPRSLRVVRSTIPEHVEEAVQTALAKVPADRFSSALQFAAALGPEGETGSALRRRRAALRRPLKLAAALLAAVAVTAILSFWKLWAPVTRALDATGGGSGPLPLSSIAVLYFQDRSETGKVGHLAAGLTEDLIDRLAAVKALRVISPDGVRRYRDKDAPLDSLAQVFRVGTVVTGTVTRAADRLRTSVRLTDVSNGVQIFSGNFEGRLGDVLELRDSMADEVVRQLRIRLGEAVQLRERQASTSNASAWELVHRAEEVREQALALPTRDSLASKALFRQADSLLVEAESLDPHWVEPIILRGWLAYDQADRAAAGGQNASPQTILAVVNWINRAIEQANRALQRRSDAAEALELRGSARYRGWALTSLAGAHDTMRQLERAEPDLRAAANVSYPHQARALSTLSSVQQLLGKLAESNLAAQRAYETDAYLRDASAIVFRLFHTSLDLRRYADAAKWCDHGRLTYPREWLFLMCQLSLLGWSRQTAPDVAKAWNVLAQLDTIAASDVVAWLKPQMTMMVATVLARASLVDSAERVIARANQAAPGDTQMLYYEALARVRLHQPKRAAALLRELIRRNPNFLPTFRSDPAFGELWSDPQLAALR